LYEEYAVVIDYLPFGKTRSRGKFRAGAVVQMVGEKYFTLLEANTRTSSKLKPLDRVYVGKDKRKEVTYILGRIGYEDLTSGSKIELENAVERIVHSRERKFLYFFNTAQAMTPRLNSLELIPGIGKKYMWDIIDEREKKPFESLADLQTRVGISDPAKLISKRIVEELSSEVKYRLFTRFY
jgi:putative nucleotide binding protein